MEQVLLELLRTINSKDTSPATIGWAKGKFEEILARQTENKIT